MLIILMTTTNCFLQNEVYFIEYFLELTKTAKKKSASGAKRVKVHHKHSCCIAKNSAVEVQAIVETHTQKWIFSPKVSSRTLK